MSQKITEDPETPVSTSSDSTPTSRRAPFPTVRLGTVELHSLTEAQAVRHILDELAEGRGGTVITPNIDHLVRCQRSAEYHAQVDAASLVVADGMPLIWASRLQGQPLPERVAGSNVISSLSAGAAEEGRSLFLLGGAPGTAEAARDVLVERHPDLRVVGTCCPEMGFEKDPASLDALREQVREAAPDIVFVALGSPKQENLIRDLHECLPGAWWLGVGISFSFLCGDVERAPVWMQRTGLEFLHRLLQEPRRLARRYLIDGVPFALKLLAVSSVRRFSRASEAGPPPVNREDGHGQ